VAQAVGWPLRQHRQAKLLGTGVASWPQTHQSYGSEVWAARQLNAGHQAMVGAMTAVDQDQGHRSSR